MKIRHPQMTQIFADDDVECLFALTMESPMTFDDTRTNENQTC
jgi:hypothetical protein